MIRVPLSDSYGQTSVEFPAPVLHTVHVGSIATEDYSGPLDGLVDTGACRTAIPIAIADQLGFSRVGYSSIAGLDPTSPPRMSPLYYALLRIPGVVDGVMMRVFGLDRDIVILGRDFLMEMLFIMDGPTQRFSLERSSWLRRLPLRILGYL